MHLADTPQPQRAQERSGQLEMPGSLEKPMNLIINISYFNLLSKELLEKVHGDTRF